MRRKLLLAAPALAVAIVAVGAYKIALTPEAAESVERRIDGVFVRLEKDFVANLADGRYGKLSVALLIDNEGESAGAGSDEAGPTLEQEPAIRDVITDWLTGLDADALVDTERRHGLIEDVVAELRETTDEPVMDMYITDVVVQ